MQASKKQKGKRQRNVCGIDGGEDMCVCAWVASIEEERVGSAAGCLVVRVVVCSLDGRRPIICEEKRGKRSRQPQPSLAKRSISARRRQSTGQSRRDAGAGIPPPHRGRTGGACHVAPSRHHPSLFSLFAQN